MPATMSAFRRGGVSRLQLLVLAMSMSALLVSCASSVSPETGSSEAGSYPRTVTDRYGTKTKINSADHVVAAYGSVSDAIFGLGEGDRLVGRDALSADWPPGQIDKVPGIGTYSELNVEGIVALGTNLLIIPDRYASLEDNRQVTQQLEAAGIAVLALPEERRAKEDGGYSVELIEDSVRLIADALGVPGKADQLIGQMRQEETAARAAADRHCMKFRTLDVRALGPDSILVVGRGGPGDLFVRLTGSQNVAAEAGMQNFAEPEPEALVPLRPDVVFGRSELWEGGKDGVAYHKALPGIGQSPAAEAGRIFPVDNLGISASWRLIGYARELAEKLASLEC